MKNLWPNIHTVEEWCNIVQGTPLHFGAESESRGGYTHCFSLMETALTEVCSLQVPF